MSLVEVLKFGSSVLRSPGDLHVVVDEIYRRWRSGFRILAVVSAFEGVTDDLMAEVAETMGSECAEAMAAYVATGELKTGALLLGSLRQYGLPARLVDPREIGLVAEGEVLESTPVDVDRVALERLWCAYPILVLPGFYGVDTEGRTVLFGRGGSDLSALFLAAALNAGVRLLKDVPGVFDRDPARSTGAHRFSALSWERAIEVAGSLIQSKALHYARGRALSFEVGRPNEAACTRVGHDRDEWAVDGRVRDELGAVSELKRPLRIALLGCGVVGRGVYETLKRYADAFEICHVLVREVERYPDVEHLTIDPAVVIRDGVDVVIVCIGGIALAHSLIAASLSAGKFVIAANKAAVAAHGRALAAHASGSGRRLWYSAAVGGAMPVLETLARLETVRLELPEGLKPLLKLESSARLGSPVREIRGILNGTCGVVLEAWARGCSRHDAVALAQAQGFAEADPSRDLSGRDSADKLALIVGEAFGEWLEPEGITTRGLETIGDDPTGFKMISRARWSTEGITACVGPELVAAESFFGQARGAENRLEIELASGEVLRLRGQGAGRWPTTISVLGDLHEVARLVEDSER